MGDEGRGRGERRTDTHQSNNTQRKKWQGDRKKKKEVEEDGENEEKKTNWIYKGRNDKESRRILGRKDAEKG